MSLTHSTHLIWRVRLFEGPRLENLSGEQVTQFRSLKVGALLGYLALKPGKYCPREELCFAIWPEEDDTRILLNRLRVALASLRKQLEPPGIPFGAVLDVSTPGRICLREETVWCDVAAFEKAWRTGDYEEASRLLSGTLLPGYYEDWVLLERERFDTLREQLETRLLTANTEKRVPEEDMVPFRQNTPSVSLYPLPLYLTRFFSKETETRQLLELLCEYRLITITGPGGMGKTRFSIETVLKRAVPTLFVSLASITETQQVAEAVLRSLAISPSVETDLTEQLIAILIHREPLLLLLDNAEHLTESVAELVQRLLVSVPDLTVLVTSRQPLNIAGEYLFPLTPIETPSAGIEYALLLQTPAVALFVDRARRVRPDFVLTPRYAPAMSQICQLLEGMPLALELAAARVAMQTPLQIAASLATGLMQLKSHQHGLSTRHRSLRAAVQGSYDMLSPDLQRFFAMLSVFQGGWTQEAARIVTGYEETEAYLEDLMRRSLLVLKEDAAAGVIRFSFLESIRQFAAEQLTASEAESLTQRHSEFYLKLASGVDEDDIRTLAPLDPEKENLLFALETGWNRQGTLLWQGLLGVLAYSYVRGEHRVSLHWAERTLSILASVPDGRLKVRLGYACYMPLSYAGNSERVLTIGEQMHREGVERDDSFALIHANLILAFLEATAENLYQAMEYAQEALRLARESGEAFLICLTLRVAGWVWHSFAIAQKGLETETVRKVLQECVVLTEECLTITPPRSSHLTYVHLNLAYAHGSLGDFDASYLQVRIARRTGIEHGMYAMLIFCFLDECHLAISRACYDYAAVMFGAFRALREKTGYTYEGTNAMVEYPLRVLMEHHGKERFEALTKKGGQLSFEEIEVLSLYAPPVFDV